MKVGMRGRREADNGWRGKFIVGAGIFTMLVLTTITHNASCVKLLYRTCTRGMKWHIDF